MSEKPEISSEESEDAFKALRESAKARQQAAQRRSEAWFAIKVVTGVVLAGYLLFGHC